MTNLIIGAAETKIPGWVSTDICDLDVTQESSWDLFLNGKFAERILSEHVWEHLSQDDTIKANLNVFKFLKPGGNYRIAVPDGYNPDPEYINYVKPGGVGAGAHDHKILYNYKTLGESLMSVGFKVELLEYWDEFGKFKFIDWDITDGKVIRSKRFDPRNTEGVIKYTSLIIDAKKPN